MIRSILEKLGIISSNASGCSFHFIKRVVSMNVKVLLPYLIISLKAEANDFFLFGLINSFCFSFSFKFINTEIILFHASLNILDLLAFIESLANLITSTIYLLFLLLIQSSYHCNVCCIINTFTAISVVSWVAMAVFMLEQSFTCRSIYSLSNHSAFVQVLSNPEQSINIPRDRSLTKTICSFTR